MRHKESLRAVLERIVELGLGRRKLAELTGHTEPGVKRLLDELECMGHVVSRRVVGSIGERSYRATAAGRLWLRRAIEHQDAIDPEPAMADRLDTE